MDPTQLQQMLQALQSPQGGGGMPGAGDQSASLGLPSGGSLAGTPQQPMPPSPNTADPMAAMGGAGSQGAYSSPYFNQQTPSPFSAQTPYQFLSQQPPMPAGMLGS